jgi:hypothetical protein
MKKQEIDDNSPDFVGTAKNDNGVATVAMGIIELNPNLGESPYVRLCVQWRADEANGELPEVPDIWEVNWFHYLEYLIDEHEHVISGSPDPELVMAAFNDFVDKLPEGCVIHSSLN